MKIFLVMVFVHPVDGGWKTCGNVMKDQQHEPAREHFFWETVGISEMGIGRFPSKGVLGNHPVVRAFWLVLKPW